MIALVGAMFVSVGPARAAQGDVSATSGFCVASTADENTPAHRVESLASGGVALSVETGEDDDTATATDNDANTFADDESKAAIPCSADQVGKPVTVTPDGTTEPIVEVKSPALSISVNDSDGVIKAGTDVAVTVKYTNSEDASPTLSWIRVSGVLDGPTDPNPFSGSCGADFGTCTSENTGAAGTDTSSANNIIIPEGTSEGKYTISARIMRDPDGAGTRGDEALTATKVITVGDPGTNVASASLELGTETYDNAATVKDETTPESGTKPASDIIMLKVAVANSLGNSSNASGVNSITVFATGGATLDIFPANVHGRPMTAKADNSALDPADTAHGENSATLNEVTDTSITGNEGDEVGSTMFIRVDKTNDKPGSIDVWAIVTGSDGSGTTETLTLNFTGAASTLDVGSVPNSAPGTTTEFSVAATDAGGSEATIGRLRFKVTNADGVAQGGSVVRVTQGTVGDSTPEDDTDDGKGVVGVVEIGAKTEPGDYTITTSIVGVDDSEETNTVTVVGLPADVAVETSASSSDTIGDVIDVTATITDADGNHVADDTPVTFDVSSMTGLASIGTGHGMTDGVGNSETKDGVASVKYAVVGHGTSVISATAGASTGVAVVVSTAGQTGPAVEEEATVACLSEKAGFSTWTCDVEASASEIFGWISSRGASALHLNSNNMWVRYSVVDGTMVPGSSDFMVTANDILYISN